MNLITTFFTVTGILIFIGFIGEWIFEKTNIPDVIWLMFLGIGVGQFIKITDNAAVTELAPIFTTFALIFILFEGAINIDIRKMMKGVASGGSLSILNFFLSMIIVALVMMVVGWSFIEGLLMGAIIGGVSSAVIIPMTKKLKMKPNTALILTFESAISDVLCIVGTLTILNIMILQSFSVGAVVQKIMYSFGIAIFVGVVGGLAWIKLNKMMEQVSKSYMTTIAAILLLYSFVEFLESNGAIAALSFGIIVGNSKRIFSFIDSTKDYKMTTSEKFFFAEISFFVKTFFFFYLGMIINLTDLPLILLGFLLTLILFLIRPLAVSIASRKYKLRDKDRIFMEILTPKGLAAAVLAQLPAQAGVAFGDQFSTIVLAVIMFSILISTIGVFLTERGKFSGIRKLLDLRKLKR